MALSPVRSDRFPAEACRTFTTAGAQVVLADQTNTPIAANPNGLNQLPSLIMVLPPAAGGALVWLDAFGTSNTLTFPAAAAGTPVAPFPLPSTAKSIEVGTAAGFQISVAWHVEP